MNEYNDERRNGGTYMKAGGNRSDSGAGVGVSRLNDLRITGNGSSSGGQYDKVKIIGDSII